MTDDAPGPTPRQTSSHATQYADGGNLRARQALHETYGAGGGDWFRWVFDHLPQTDRLDALELGAGPGRLWVRNADRIPSDWRVVVSDLSDGMRAEAETALAGRPQFAFARVDAQDIPFDADSFDVVVANHMLYHVPDIARAMAEVRRVLRRGGIFLAATNGADHMKELDALARTALPATLADLAERRDELGGFQLENGAAILGRWFERVERHDARHPLVVPDAEPLVAYLASIGSLQASLAARDRAERQRLLAAATERVRTHIERLGPVRITRSSGLFVAS